MKRKGFVFFLVFIISFTCFSEQYMSFGNYEITVIGSGYSRIFKLVFYNQGGVTHYIEYNGSSFYSVVRFSKNIDTDLNTYSFEILTDDKLLYGKKENLISQTLTKKDFISETEAKTGYDNVFKKSVSSEGYVSEYRVALPNYKAVLLLKPLSYKWSIDIGFNEKHEHTVTSSKGMEAIRVFGIIMDVGGVK